MKSPIKQYRIKTGLTQAAFGKLVGLSQTSVALIESGNRNVNPSKCAHYEKVTGGQLTRYKLRPDVFGAMPKKKAQPEIQT